MAVNLPGIPASALAAAAEARGVPVAVVPIDAPFVNFKDPGTLTRDKLWDYFIVILPVLVTVAVDPIMAALSDGSLHVPAWAGGIVTVLLLVWKGYEKYKLEERRQQLVNGLRPAAIGIAVKQGSL